MPEKPFFPRREFGFQEKTTNDANSTTIIKLKRVLTY